MAIILNQDAGPRMNDSHSNLGDYRRELPRRLCLVVELPVVVAAPCPPVLPDDMLSPIVELVDPPAPLVVLPTELPPDVDPVPEVDPLVPLPMVPEPVVPVPMVPESIVPVPDWPPLEVPDVPEPVEPVVDWATAALVKPAANSAAVIKNVFLMVFS
jgi:hypothetical protein